MKIINPVTYMKDHFRGFRLSKMDAETDYIEKQEEEDVHKLIAADILEVFDTHLLIDGLTYVRCIVGGLTEEDIDGIPPGMNEIAMERIMALTNEGARVELCTGIVKIPRVQMSRDLKEAYISNSIDQKNAQAHTEGSIEDLQLKNEKKDIEATYDETYYYSQNSYNASFIITLMGGETEVFTTEAKVLGVLQSELIEYSIPYELMLQAFLASRPYPVSDDRFQVVIHSDTAAILCTSTSINPTIDDEGMLFGKDRTTGADVVINEKAIPSRHRIYFGPTGSGKSLTAAMHLWRAIDFYNCRGCVITPKHELENFLALAEHMGDRATVIYIGETGSPINPMQIVFDPVAMGNSAQAATKAYHKHVRLLKAFFTAWLSDIGDKNTMKGYIEETVHRFYTKAGIDRLKPETFKKECPLLGGLHDIWGADMNDESLSANTRKTAEALWRKTAAIGPNGTYSYLNQPMTEPIDYSKDLIVFDISGVDEEIKDAMYVLVTGILGNRYQVQQDKETIIVIDEARIFLQNDYLNGFIMDGVALGRSYGVFFWPLTQNPSDLSRNSVDEEFKANIPISIVMGATLEPYNVGPIKAYFHLTDSETEDLMGCQQGDGILKVRGETYPMRFEPTLEEYAALKRLNVSDAALPVVGSGGYTIKQEFKDFVDHHQVILRECIEGNEDKLIADGWVKRSRLPTIKGRGSCTMWHRPGAVNGNLMNIPKLGKMTVDHYVCVIQIESWLIQNGVECHTDHNHGADVEFEVDGKMYAIEYEKAHSHTAQELIEKKGRLLELYEAFRFSCAANSEEYDVIASSVGAEYMAPRGEAIMQFLTDAIRGALGPSPDNYFGGQNDAKIDEIEDTEEAEGIEGNESIINSEQPAPDEIEA